MDKLWWGLKLKLGLKIMHVSGHLSTFPQYLKEERFLETT